MIDKVKIWWLNFNIDSLSGPRSAKRDLEYYSQKRKGKKHTLVTWKLVIMCSFSLNKDVHLIDPCLDQSSINTRLINNSSDCAQR